MGNHTEKTPTAADEAYQDHILQGVSRTFALTIPTLPYPLSRVVSNAYLLCRIADTIEDDKHMPVQRKRDFSRQFIECVRGTVSVEDFSTSLHPQLSPTATDDEKDLIQNTPIVLRITHSFNQRQRAALERCVSIMAEGMTQYQETDVKNGLKDQADMDRYCYFVAGVVGEMLTELFCDYSDEIDKHREVLMRLAVSFGQGLQMTNILKDIWDDQSRDMCWLPRDIFQQHGADLENIATMRASEGFQMALGQLIGVARAHLSNALSYILLIPSSETGIRRFCLWALGMAVLTLRKINNNRAFSSGQEVKISRRSVKATIILTSLLTRQDRLLRILFNLTARTLPESEIPEIFQPVTKTA